MFSSASTLEPWMLVLAAFAGLACGFLNAVASSGSAVTLPILMMIGLDPITANATNRLPVLCGAMSAAGSFQRKGAIPWRLAFRVSIPVTIGTAFGAALAEVLPGRDLGLMITAAILVALILLLLGKRFTGAGSHGLLYAQDKAVAKKILEFHGLHTPVFARSYRGRLDFSHDLEFPVIVKPAREDGSIGIEFNAVVNSIRELMERIDWLHANFDSPVLIEEYVEGREMYVGVLGNDNPVALPVVELDLSKLPEGTPRIAGAEVKWGKGTKAYRDTKSAVAENLPEEAIATMQQTAVAVF